MSAPSLKGQFRELIKQALSTPYTSHSCKDQIETGNHYQSIELDGVQTRGFRSARQEFLDQINFQGKKVLDLGSNLGEMSRMARKRGASLVDGFEYDSFFVDVANAINVHNGVTRVSFYQRDITKSEIYQESYDIVMALSVWTYAYSVLPQIAKYATGLFLVETHKLNNNLERDYLGPCSKYFKSYKILGKSDWGTFEEQGERAVIAFAKTDADLAEGLITRTDSPSQVGASSHEMVNVRQTQLISAFFKRFPEKNPDALLQKVETEDCNIDELAKDDDLSVHVYSGWSYWFIFLKGYVQYRKSGVVGNGNAYYDYFVKYYLPQRKDPGLAGLTRSESAVSVRIAQRFSTLDQLRNCQTDRNLFARTMAPLKIAVKSPPSGSLYVKVRSKEAPLQAAWIDGWHRFFAAKLLGLTEYPAVVSKES